MIATSSLFSYIEKPYLMNSYVMDGFFEVRKCKISCATNLKTLEMFSVSFTFLKSISYEIAFPMSRTHISVDLITRSRAGFPNRFIPLASILYYDEAAIPVPPGLHSRERTE